MKYKEELLKQLCSRLDGHKTQSYSLASEVRQSELNAIITIVKTLNLDFVSNRRELLNDFSDKFNKQNELYDKPYIDTEDIEDYLKGVL